MVWAVSLLTMKLIPHRLTSCVISAGILSLSRFGTAFRRPHRNSALPPALPQPLRLNTFRGEPASSGSIGISPLTTPHPPIFQHRSVRTSTWCYPSFILDMVRSPRFGSINTDDFALFRLAFAVAITESFSPTSAYNSPAHSSTGTRSDVESSCHCL